MACAFRADRCSLSPLRAREVWQCNRYSDLDGNAVYDATGVLIPSIPLTPEKVWRALQGKK